MGMRGGSGGGHEGRQWGWAWEEVVKVGMSEGSGNWARAKAVGVGVSKGSGGRRKQRQWGCA